MSDQTTLEVVLSSESTVGNPIIETVKGGVYTVTGRYEASSYYQVDYNGQEA